jgi:hypothetical protein
MGTATSFGEVNVMCSATATKPCTALVHSVIELDYENTPSLWGLVPGRHVQVIEQVKPVAEEYLKEVDADSTFVIWPVEPNPYSVVTALQMAIADYKEALKEDKTHP